MNSDALFGLSILMSFIAFGIVAKLFIWPRLRVMRREDALFPLVFGCCYGQRNRVAYRIHALGNTNFAVAYRSRSNASRMCYFRAV